MKVTVLFFGKLGEIPGKKSMDLEDLKDTESLIEKLNTDFPGFNEMKYLVAVDKQIVQGNTPLSDNCTVALLPPYAGG